MTSVEAATLMYPSDDSKLMESYTTSCHTGSVEPRCDSPLGPKVVQWSGCTGSVRNYRSVRSDRTKFFGPRSRVILHSAQCSWLSEEWALLMSSLDIVGSDGRRRAPHEIRPGASLYLNDV